MDLYLLIVFIFGTIIGSFLNVIIYRYGTGTGMGGRSICLSCSKTLHWHELIPVASFLLQKGKCRQCLTKISRVYPVVEISTGVIFAWIFWKLKFLLAANPAFFALMLAYQYAVWSLLIVIAAYDIRHKYIPNGLVIPLIILSFFSAFISPDFSNLSGFQLANLWGGLVLSLGLGAIWFFSAGKLMGLGDVKLVFGLGLLLGLSKGITAFFLAFWIGAVIGILLVVLGSLRKLSGNGFSLKSEIPFAPFLILGALIAFLGNIDLAILANFFMAIQF
jgi:prepilin signal peptidase PulO-like enzyme (type II secretory pathway)